MRTERPLKVCSVRLPEPGDRVWDAWLERGEHDFYHLASYVRLEAEHQECEPLLLLAEEDDSALLWPLMVRPLPPEVADGSGARDAMSPYGYPSPIFIGPRGRDPGWAGSALGLLVRTLKDLNICAAFSRLHPVLPRPRGVLELLGTVVEHGDTVWIDLALGEGVLWERTRATHRNLIGRLQRMGAVTRFDTELALLADFVEIYTDTMWRVNAADSYFYSLPYFQQLREALGHRLTLAIVDLDGAQVCGGLFTESCGIVQFHLAGTAPGHRKLSPTRLMLHDVRRWAKARGNRIFHLGGGIGAAEDSLFEFKAGFSNLRAKFRTWRVISQPDHYARAVACWERVAGTAAGRPTDAFFPPYRKPLPQPSSVG